MLRVFSLYFVKEGIFEQKVSHIFAKLMKFRENADYNPLYIFTRKDFIEFRYEANNLADRTGEHLVKKRIHKSLISDCFLIFSILLKSEYKGESRKVKLCSLKKIAIHGGAGKYLQTSISRPL